MIYSLYIIVNKINGKSYVGWTSRNPEKRWAEHHRCPVSAMRYAFRKYGKDSFDHCVIYQSWDKLHSLEMERHFIVEYNSIHRGYNKTPGGEGVCGYHQTPEHIEKRISRRRGKPGKPHTPTSKLKSSVSHKGILHTEESRQKISNTKRKLAAAGIHWAKTPEAKLLVSIAKSKEYLIEGEDGTRFTIKNLAQFARDHNIRSDSLRMTINTNKFYKGYKIISLESVL